MNPLRSALLAGSESPWLREQATRRTFVRRAVSRFMPGETVEEAIDAAVALRANGLDSILTNLGENVRDAEEAKAEVEHYLGVLDRARERGLDAEISIKATHLGLDLDPQLAFDNVRCLAQAAAAHKTRLWIDMESTAYTDATLAMYRRIRETGADVGLCLQSYLRRTRDDLEALIPLGPAIRVVKGAYKEPENLAYPNKRDVDECFYELCARLLDDDARAAGAWLTVGTHDLQLIARCEALAASRGVHKRDYEYALLFGIQRAEQLRLARAGHRVRVLVSYGSHWFPWYMRRLAERPANMWFVARSMFAG